MHARRLITVLSISLAACAPLVACADDWPTWRGPQRDNLCREADLLDSWPAEGPPLLWKADSLGEGFASCSVVDDVIYTMGNRNGSEQVIALNAQDGSEKWAATIGPVQHDGAGYPGPRSTPTFDEGRLYALGLNGDLVCLDVASGRVHWRKNLVSDFAGQIPTWGYSESLLVDGPWVLCTPGGSKATVAALHKTTGETVWESPIGDGAAYSSIVIVSPGGNKQYVQFTAAGVIGLRWRDGALLWRYNAPANATANIATPVFDGSLVFAASGYGTGGGMVQIQSRDDSVTAKEVYFTKDLKNHHGGMIVFDGLLFGANDPGLLTCLDFNTGKVAWKERSTGKCAILYADRHLYARSEDGQVSLIKVNPEKFELVGRFDQPDRSDQPAWPHPVIAGGRLFLRDQNKLLCYDLRNSQQK